MDTSAHWPQDNGDIKAVEKKAKPEKGQALNCPRCNSTNTKFCYYNNYNLSQPRYLCKACRRYWTQGGSLRNVPVGGGSRKNKRSSSSSSNSKIIKITPPIFSPQIHHEAQDLNLGFNPSLPYNDGSSSSSSNFFAFDAKNLNTHQNPNNVPSSNFPIMGSSSGLGLSSFMSAPGPESNSVYLSGVPVHDDRFKPGLSFSLYGNIENGYGGNLKAGFQLDHIINPSSSRILLPFEELKQPVMINASDQPEKDRPVLQGGELINGSYWNGTAAGNSSW